MLDNFNIYLGSEKVYSADGLPSAYQEVEYIDSSASGPYIDTLVCAKSTLKIQMKLTPLMVTGDTIFGNNTVSDADDYRLFNYNSNYYLDFPGGSGSGNRINGGSFPSGTTKEIEIGNFYVKDLTTGNNIISGNAISFSEKSYTLRINGTGQSYSRWYYVKVYDGEELIRDMIPCYRKSDNVIGMYDLANSVFYTNSGSGSFTKGNNA